MALKRLPSDKTLVTSLDIVLADAYTRNRLITQSMSARVGQDVGMKSGDASVTSTNTLVLAPITSIIYVQTWDSVILDLTYLDKTVPDVPCTGLFLLHGQLQAVTVRVNSGLARVMYVYA